MSISTLFYCFLDLSCSECDVISLCFMCFSGNGSVFLIYCVFDFVKCLGVVAILVLNVMDVFSVGIGALLDRPCMVFQGMCVLCL